MSNDIEYENLSELTDKLQCDLKENEDLNKEDKPRKDLKDKDFILLYAYNGIGKTRLSMEFKDKGKNGDTRDTLYFNAFTEDLFTWDNDLEGDAERVLMLNKYSRFFNCLKSFEMETRIKDYLWNYADFDFQIDYKEMSIAFSRGNEDNIKISRGEENIFIWCFFLVIVQLAKDEDIEAYSWVKYIYIDDPISSLDENNTIAVAVELSKILKEGKKIKTVISSHHSLFFNVMCNALKKSEKYFLSRNKITKTYSLENTTDKPFFYNVAMLKELKEASDKGNLFTYHFNILRSILEKTAVFFGYNRFSDCIKGDKNEKLYARVLNVLSHGNYPIYKPTKMVHDNKERFKEILEAFISKYKFNV